MENLLSEEIKRYLTLSNYDTRLTFSENTETISEQTMATTVRDVESVLSKDLSALMREYKFVGMDIGTVTNLLTKDAGTFERAWNKALAKDIKAGYPQGELGPMGKNFSKMEFFRRLSEEAKTAKSQNRTLTVSEIDSLKNEVIASSKLKASKFKPKPPKDTPKGTPKGTGKITVKPGDTAEARNLLSIKPFLRRLTWGALLAWGKTALVSLGVLYVIWKLTHNGEEPPNVDVDNQDTTTTPPAPTPPTDTNPRGRYRPCSGTYSYGCKSDSIATVQDCLGLVADGKFGPKTKEALSKKGYTSFTDADINKICGNSTNTVTPTVDDSDIEDVEGEDPNNL